MSSTSIVIKCLTDARQTASLHGQITIGTLILQVLAVAAAPPARVFLCSHAEIMFV